MCNFHLSKIDFVQYFILMICIMSAGRQLCFKWNDFGLDLAFPGSDLDQNQSLTIIHPYSNGYNYYALCRSLSICKGQDGKSPLTTVFRL